MNVCEEGRNGAYFEILILLLYHERKIQKRLLSHQSNEKSGAQRSKKYFKIMFPNICGPFDQHCAPILQYLVRLRLFRSSVFPRGNGHPKWKCADVGFMNPVDFRTGDCLGEVKEELEVAAAAAGLAAWWAGWEGKRFQKFKVEQLECDYKPVHRFIIPY